MGEQSLSDRVILIIQRQWVVSQTLASAFEAEGMRVLRASSSDAGRSFIEQSDLACAVLDSAGCDLCRTLTGKGIPFVMYTGREVIDDECAGAPVIKKPAAHQEVVALVKRML